MQHVDETFEQTIEHYVKIRTAARAARTRSAKQDAMASCEDARRAVIRARPLGMTTLEVARRLRAADQQSLGPTSTSARS